MTCERWLRTSFWLQAALTVYFEAVMWFPLGAWNDQPGSETLLHAVRNGDTLPALEFSVLFLMPILLFLFAYRKRWILLLLVGTLCYWGWAAMQIQSWWIPYLFGANARALRNAHALAGTTKILPSFTNRPAPDGMHMVLDLLIFAVAITAAVGTLKLMKLQRSCVR